MPRVDVVVESVPSRSSRARQIEGMFDVPPRQKQKLQWAGDVPLDAEPWNVGLIVGPSGCGKSTVARSLFGGALDKKYDWRSASVIDDFPAGKSVQEIADICQAVGFNTIPAWLRPHDVLSNGEKFRVDIARRLLDDDPVIVVDEFTSVVDRQVAKIGSHAVQKHVRKQGRQFVAVSCHYDIVDWLNPDWILEPATMTFARRSLQRRPSIDVEITKVRHDAWRLFAPYHYMTAELHKAAQCYCLFVGEQPAVFGAMMYRPHEKTRNIWGLSRVVTLPDYQGLGLAFVLMDALAAAFSALGQRMRTYPAHPALIRAFDRSAKWSLEKKPKFSALSSSKQSGKGGMQFGGRPNAVFEWRGDAMDDREQARRLLAIRSLG